MTESPWAHFGLIVSSVLGVFCVIGVGGFCRNRRWLTNEADFSLAKITANVLIPALFFDRIINDPTLGPIATIWTAPVLGFSITVGSFLLARLIARTLGPWFGLKTDQQQRAFTLCAGICNYGYIPLPLSQIFYPEAEVELILHNVGVDLALWSVGIAIISGGRPDQPADTSTGIRRWLGKLKPAFSSAPLAAAVIALLIREFGLDAWMTAPILKPISLLANAAIPVGLLLIGAIIVDFVDAADWTGAFRVITLGVGFRLLLMPVIMLSIAANLVTQVDLQHVLLLQAAMPTAVFPIILVRLYAGDTATALRVVLSTSIIGILSIPIWMAVGAWWLTS
ncbi:hypothetical protein SAMN06265222_11448 [Neorhodopirellula lusitana]|uniref:Malate permease n=1 Tax=Neorhodopirellula lusitana TaxID=445327 RepID=A0ABY1QK76_9BACT|nr:AEC family transporter [Neorhodopirellula lusitana]SMP71416.1 hypothetical protein SAMN06265222_11448 [Neorhodopirellula lusitana]